MESDEVNAGSDKLYITILSDVVKALDEGLSLESASAVLQRACDSFSPSISQDDDLLCASDAGSNFDLTDDIDDEDLYENPNFPKIPKDIIARLVAEPEAVRLVATHTALISKWLPAMSPEDRWKQKLAFLELSLSMCDFIEGTMSMEPYKEYRGKLLRSRFMITGDVTRSLRQVSIVLSTHGAKAMKYVCDVYKAHTDDPLEVIETGFVDAEESSFFEVDKWFAIVPMIQRMHDYLERNQGIRRSRLYRDLGYSGVVFGPILTSWAELGIVELNPVNSSDYSVWVNTGVLEKYRSDVDTIVSEWRGGLFVVGQLGPLPD